MYWGGEMALYYIRAVVAILLPSSLVHNTDAWRLFAL